MPPRNPAPKSALRNECAILNRRLAQLLGDASAWKLAGVRWLLQRFYYHVDTGEGHRMSMHRHNWFELTLVDRGRADYSTPRLKGTLATGDVFFMSPGEMHQWRASATPLVLTSFQLRPEALNVQGERLLQTLAAKSRADIFRLQKPASLARLNKECRRLLDERPSALLGEKLQAVVRLFILEFVELAAPEALPPVPETPSVEDRAAGAKNEQIIEFVRNNLHHPIKLDDIADHFHYSVRQIARQFQRENGIALGHYILEQKLQVAQRLLATTDQPVKEIALSLGYGSVSYFCRLFSDYTNNTPSDYRILVHAQKLSP